MASLWFKFCSSPCPRNRRQVRNKICCSTVSRPAIYVVTVGVYWSAHPNRRSGAQCAAALFPARFSVHAPSAPGQFPISELLSRFPTDPPCRMGRVSFGPLESCSISAPRFRHLATFARGLVSPPSPCRRYRLPKGNLESTRKLPKSNFVPIKNYPLVSGQQKSPSGEGRERSKANDFKFKRLSPHTEGQVFIF